MKLVVVPSPRPQLSESARAAVADALGKLVARDGRVTPESFLEAASPPESPLHGLFEWDDRAAAREHRLHQARQIVRCVIYRSVKVENERRRTTIDVSPSPRCASPPPALPAARSCSPEQPPPPPVTHAAGAGSVLVEVDAEMTARQLVTRAGAASDREVFLVELSTMFGKIGRDLTVEDVARAAWDAGFSRSEIGRQAPEAGKAR